MAWRKSGLVMLVLLMAVVMVLTGCSKNNSQNQASEASQTPAASPSNKDDGEQPQQRPEVTITGWVDFKPDAGSEGISSYSDQMSWKEIPKLTGVTVKWTTSSDYKTEFPLVMASGNLPDFFGHIEPLQAEKYGRQGAVIPLEELIDQYAPNLKQLLTDRPDIKAQVTSPDGHIYFFPRVSPAQNYAGFTIREDWLQKIGKDVPSTTDELYETLKAFKEQDANGNGKMDEIPLTGDPRALIWQFGVGSRAYASSDDFFIEDEKIKYGPLDPRYKEALQYLNKLYAEGLIDPEYEGQKRDQLDARINQEISGFVFGSNASYMTRFNKNLEAAGKNPGFVAMEPPAGPAGVRSLIGQNNIVDSGRGGAISSSSKYAKEITQMVDYFYSEEGQLLMYFGKEGDTYEMKDGVPTYTDKVLNHPKLGVLAYVNSYIGYASGFPSVLPEESYTATLDDNGKKGYEIGKKYASKHKAPNLFFTEEETGKVTTLLRDINTYVDENANAFIRGAKKFDEYDAYLDGLKKIGVDELISLYNASYDRYLKIVKG